MNRALALACTALVVVYAALYAYDVGNSHALDVAISVLVIASGLIVIAHLFADRGLHLWNAATVGILLAATVLPVVLFAFFGWLYAIGPLSDGAEQGWLDVVRAVALVGCPSLSSAVLLYRVDKHRSGQPTEPGELLIVESATYRGPERRVGPPDRRRRDPYGRKKGQTS